MTNMNKIDFIKSMFSVLLSFFFFLRVTLSELKILKKNEKSNAPRIQLSLPEIGSIVEDQSNS